jgi:hypothetical protein
MDGIGGVVAVIRRVPPFAIWAVLSTLWVVSLKVFWPDSQAYEYFQAPAYLGVALLAARHTPRRHQAWLPPLISLAVNLPLVLGWKALS